MQPDPRLQEINAYQGFNSVNGITVTDWQEGKGEVQLRITAEHTNPAGLVHGGVMMGMLDVVLALPGSYEEPPLKLMPGLTISLHTEFISAARPEDELLIATATKTGGGRNIFFAAGELRAADDRLIARASGVFKRGRQPQNSQTD